MIHTDKFDGVAYRKSDNWFEKINLHEFAGRPIYYLEIGTFYGANLFHVAETYAAHTKSILFCIDPWTDYDEYDNTKTSNHPFIPLSTAIFNDRGFGRKYEYVADIPMNKFRD